MNFDEMVKGAEAPETPTRFLELRKPSTVVVGGLPMVSLLPRELRSAARDRSIRRGFVGAVVLAVIVAAGATAISSTVASSAQDRLTQASARSSALAAQLGKFRDVQMLQTQLALGKAAVTVGSSTEIDWQARIDAIEADMPAGYVVTSTSADGAKVFEDFQQGATPLEQPRVATVQMSITAPTIIDLPPWLRKLRSIPSYADATASVSPGDGGAYEVQVTIHLSAKAFTSSSKAAR